MRVLFINQSLGIGGAETFNSSLFAWLKKHQVQIISYVANNRFADMLGTTHIIPIVLDIIGNWRGLLKACILAPFGCIYYFYIFIRNLDCDIVFMTGFVEKLVITPLACLFNKPVVWVEFGPLESVFEKFYGLPKFFYNLVCTLPDIVIMPTHNTFNHNMKICPISPAKTKIIPCAITRPDNCKHNPIRNLVVCISRLEKGKGQDLLIQAWPKVLKTFPDAKLRIIGEGDFKLKKTKNVDMVGWVENVWPELEKASVLVFPSVWPLEGFGLVMVEAMSLGIPIVAFNQGTAPEIVDKKSGILTVDLSAGIIAMLKHPTRGGKTRFENNYSFNIIGPKYLDILNYVVATH